MTVVAHNAVVCRGPMPRLQAFLEDLADTLGSRAAMPETCSD